MSYDFRKQKRVLFVLNECNNSVRVLVTKPLLFVETGVEEMIKSEPLNLQI